MWLYLWLIPLQENIERLEDALLHSKLIFFIVRTPMFLEVLHQFHQELHNKQARSFIAVIQIKEINKKIKADEKNKELMATFHFKILCIVLHFNEYFSDIEDEM